MDLYGFIICRSYMEGSIGTFLFSYFDGAFYYMVEQAVKAHRGVEV
jgi:hypothetical protein